MKKIIILALSVTTLFASCSKSSNEPETTQPTLLLKRITETTDGTPVVNIELTYNGKQLTKASYEKNANGSFAIEHNFTYNSYGQLTGMNVTSTIPQPTYKKADITYNGNDLAQVSFTRYDNTLTKVSYTYNNGKLATEKMENTGSTINSQYTYDASGHNTKQTYSSISGGQTLNGTYEFSTFDDKKSLISALPSWIYFKAYSYDMQGLGDAFGTNNALTGKLTATGGTYPTNETYTYSYTYNSYGYPATMTRKDNTGSIQSFSYDYIEVK
ncbi:hypothetical protein [Mucilaginibacter lacusdianchii]|uniref:hypothetical protein n=1 Tax=Mucilaginibacter lacusdianchii TaxID=2684211 RepID=UPI00131CB041|nr:hypothetical protein [Mucilaginibacter sp. JXJ CY 39]